MTRNEEMTRGKGQTSKREQDVTPKGRTDAKECDREGEVDDDVEGKFRQVVLVNIPLFMDWLDVPGSFFLNQAWCY